MFLRISMSISHHPGRPVSSLTPSQIHDLSFIIHTHTHTCMHTHSHIHTHSHMHIHTHKRTCITHTHMYTHTHICTHTHMYRLLCLLSFAHLCMCLWLTTWDWIAYSTEEDLLSPSLSSHAGPGSREISPILVGMPPVFVIVWVLFRQPSCWGSVGATFLPRIEVSDALGLWFLHSFSSSFMIFSEPEVQKLYWRWFT